MAGHVGQPVLEQDEKAARPIHQTEIGWAIFECLSYAHRREQNDMASPDGERLEG